jgi:hypothetical protein
VNLPRLAPSAENACSNLHEVGVISDHALRTTIVRPSVERLRVEELATALRELADGRHAEPPPRPFAALRLRK